MSACKKREQDTRQYRRKRQAEPKRQQSSFLLGFTWKDFNLTKRSAVITSRSITVTIYRSRDHESHYIVLCLVLKVVKCFLANSKGSSGLWTRTACRKSARRALSSGCFRMYSRWSSSRSPYCRDTASGWNHIGQTFTRSIGRALKLQVHLCKSHVHMCTHTH